MVKFREKQRKGQIEWLDPKSWDGGKTKTIKTFISHDIICKDEECLLAYWEKGSCPEDTEFLRGQPAIAYKDKEIDIFRRPKLKNETKNIIVENDYNPWGF